MMQITAVVNEHVSYQIPLAGAMTFPEDLFYLKTLVQDGASSYLVRGFPLFRLLSLAGIRHNMVYAHTMAFAQRLFANALPVNEESLPLYHGECGDLAPHVLETLRKLNCWMCNCDALEAQYIAAIHVSSFCNNAKQWFPLPAHLRNFFSNGMLSYFCADTLFTDVMINSAFDVYQKEFLFALVARSSLSYAALENVTRVFLSNSIDVRSCKAKCFSKNGQVKSMKPWKYQTTCRFLFRALNLFAQTFREMYLTDVSEDISWRKKRKATNYVFNQVQSTTIETLELGVYKVTQIHEIFVEWCATMKIELGLYFKMLESWKSAEMRHFIRMVKTFLCKMLVGQTAHVPDGVRYYLISPRTFE
jgi:hypothetical protein